MTSSPSFAAVHAVYECSRACHAEYHPVDHHLFERFWRVCCAFERTAGPAATEDIVRPLFRASRARFGAAATPLSFDQLVFFRGVEDPATVVDKVRAAYPGMAREAQELAGLVGELSASVASPLFERLEALGYERGIEAATIVVRAPKLLESCRDRFNSSPILSSWDVIAPDALREAREYGRLFFIGPTGWFPDYVFAAPRAAELHVISYAWLLRSWSRRREFIGALGASEEAIGDRPQTLDVEPIEQWPQPDWAEITRRGLDLAEPGTLNDQDEAEARLFLLGCELAVFLDVSDGSTSLVIDPDSDDAARVLRVLSDEIEPGTFLLLRTEGGGDYIPPLADKLLGEQARAYRAMQAEWKRRLRDAVAASREVDVSSRLIDVSVQLLDLGAQRADENNLRYWMSARSICTRDRRDFRAILTLVGLDSEFDRYWGVMRQILAAHHRAGRRIRRKLVERVREVPTAALVGAQRIEFALPDEEGGRLTAFLVERGAPGRAMIPRAREGRVFEREEW